MAVYSVILLGLLNVVNILDMMIVAVIMPALKQSFHLSDSQIGLLGGASRIVGAIAGIPLARVADSWIRKRLLLISLVTWSVLTVLCGTAGSFAQVLVMRLGVGAAEAAAPPTSHSLVADLVPPARRPGAFAVLTLGGTLGNGLGLALGGIFIDVIGWRGTFVAMGLPGLVLAVVIASTFREPPRGRFDTRANSATRNSAGEALRSLLGRRSYVHMLVGATLISLATAVAVWLPSSFVRTFHLSLATVGSSYGTVYAASSIIGVVTGGLLGNRLIPRDVRWGAWLPMIALLFYPPLMAAMLFAPSFPAALTVAVLFSIMIGSANSPLFATIQAVARPNERATAIALVLLLAGVVGAGGGPIMIGVLSDQFTKLGASNPLRDALLVLSAFPFWGAVQISFATRSLRDDARLVSGVAPDERLSATVSHGT